MISYPDCELWTHRLRRLAVSRTAALANTRNWWIVAASASKLTVRHQLVDFLESDPAGLFRPTRPGWNQRHRASGLSGLCNLKFAICYSSFVITIWPSAEWLIPREELFAAENPKESADRQIRPERDFR